MLYALRNLTIESIRTWLYLLMVPVESSLNLVWRLKLLEHDLLLNWCAILEFIIISKALEFVFLFLGKALNQSTYHIIVLVSASTHCFVSHERKLKNINMDSSVAFNSSAMIHIHVFLNSSIILKWPKKLITKGESRLKWFI